MLHVFAISLGCPKNRVDTEQALGFSRQIVMVDNPADADWIFLNTCGFIAPAVEESIQTIMEYVAFVSELPEETRPKLIVAGCLVGRYGQAPLAEELPEVDLFLDAKNVGDWRAALAVLAGGGSFPQGKSGAGDVAARASDNALAGACGIGAGVAGTCVAGSGVVGSGEAGSGAQGGSINKACVNGLSVTGGLANSNLGNSSSSNSNPGNSSSSNSSLGNSSPGNSIPERNAETALPRVLSTPPSYAWLKISEGCRHACAFCTIPAIRGKLVSSPLDSLVHEASFIVEQGVKELILVAQDVTAWGKDKGGRLQDLLEKIFLLPGLERVRLMYLYPVGLDDELLSFLQQAGKPFVPYFDMPLQHASSHVLKRMGRPFAGNPRQAIERIRHYFPEAALRTTLITGFPGETEEDFLELVDFVEDTRFHHLGVFPYYAEEGTPAAAMPDQVPDEVKNYRRDIIMENQESISEELMQGYLGTIQDILVDSVHEEWPGLHTGRAWFQAPEIDGQVYISGRDVQPGALVKAEITDTDTYDMSALSVKGA